MSTRNFWKTKDSSGKGTPSGTPSTTPSTSFVEEDSLQQISLPISLSSAIIQSGFLYKQSSKRRVFGTSNWQKRYFVLTSNEIAYREKETEDSEWRGAWRIPSEVLSIDPPIDGSKDFSVSISKEGGAMRILKLSASDSATAKEWASAISNVLKAALGTPTKTGGDDLAITDIPTTSEEPAVEVAAQEEPMDITEDDHAQSYQPEAVPTEVSEQEEIAVITEPPEPIADITLKQKSTWVWLWSFCCSAE